MGRLRPTQGRAKSPLQKQLSDSNVKDKAIIIVQNRDMSSHSSSNCISNAINNYTALAVVEEQPHKALSSSSDNHALRDFIDPELGSGSAINESELLFIDFIIENKNNDLESSLVIEEAEESEHRSVIDAGISHMETNLDMDAIQTDTLHLSRTDEHQTDIVNIGGNVQTEDRHQPVLIESRKNIIITFFTSLKVYKAFNVIYRYKLKQS